MARRHLTVGQWLKDLNACKDGIAWIGDKSVYYAWRYCPHADYLCWLYGALDPHLGVRSAIAIARHATAGQWFDRRLEEVYDHLLRWSGQTYHDPVGLRRRAHYLQTELNDHPLAKALTWASVCATANTPALAGEAASVSCMASVESLGQERDRSAASLAFSNVLRSTISVNDVENAWKRTVRAMKRR